jgi:hypothetical protein
MEIARKFKWRLLLVSTRLVGYCLTVLALLLPRVLTSAHLFKNNDFSHPILCQVILSGG